VENAKPVEVVVVKFVYPEPGTLPSLYASNTALLATTDEVVLDFAEMQPQARSPDSASIDALVKMRITISRGHGQRLLTALQQVLSQPAPARIQ
jgi:hypothetical protein